MPTRRHEATKLLNNNVYGLNLRFVEKLCIFLKCTPNDLLCWTLGINVMLSDNLPLKALKRMMAQMEEYKTEEKMKSLAH